MTNETLCGKKTIYVLSIFGQILVDVMEIFQDGAFPNLEYHLFQVFWCVSALICIVTVTNETFCGKNISIYE